MPSPTNRPSTLTITGQLGDVMRESAQTALSYVRAHAGDIGAPNDGREWILIDEAAALFGIKPVSMAAKMRKLNFTRTARCSVKAWLLK